MIAMASRRSIAAAARRAFQGRRSTICLCSHNIIDGSICDERTISSGSSLQLLLHSPVTQRANPTNSGIYHQRLMVCSRAFSTTTETTIENISSNEVTSDMQNGSRDDNDGVHDLDSSASNNAHSTRVRRRRKRPNNTSDITEDTTPSAALPPLTSDEYNPEQIIEQIFDTSRWKHKWKDDNQYEHVRLVVDDYERHLRYVLDHLDKAREEESRKIEEEQSSDIEVAGQSTTSNSSSSNSSDMLLSNIHPSPEKCKATHKLLSSKVLANAIRSLIRTRMDTPLLSQRIRDIEKIVGLIGWTPITEELSYRLLEANGKAGNVRRTLALLELRRRRGYTPREQDERTFQEGKELNNVGIRRGEKEFIHAIQSIQSAQLPLRRSRNIYLHESQLSDMALDNPTRYLDAILLNMNQREVPLRPEIATQMLHCYASMGRTGRAIHYFYKVVRDPIEEDGFYIAGPHPTHLGEEELGEWKERRRRDGMGRVVVSGFEDEEEGDGNEDEEDSIISIEEEDAIIDSSSTKERTKPRMIMHPLPPFHKIPSHVEGANLAMNSDHQRPISFVKASSRSSSSNQQEPAQSIKTPKTKYEWEVDREWSLSLTAAFAFADSLTHGACGHDPIELNVGGWNCLIKACCYRGAFHRALKILNETMPQKGIEPDSYSYNTILAGLARVGDISSLKEYLMNMTNKRVPIDKYTVQAMADGFLNVGDISGASTMVQDVFNQHDTLPPYTTHLKIVEFALSNGLIFEAKRHVYFIQQLWKWEPSPHHDKPFISMMEAMKHNPKLSKKALQKLFRHFSEELHDDDFF